MDFFTLNEYKSSSQYILFFEGLIKQEKVTKDAFLSDLGISTSSPLIKANICSCVILTHIVSTRKNVRLSCLFL